MTRDGKGRFATPHDTIPLVVRRLKSQPHVEGWLTRRAKWVPLRDAMTARLRAEAGL